jgi:RNA polymerase sigma-70 factor (ECF subfamily)
MAAENQPADRELEWMRQIAQGSREAFELLFRAWQTRLFRYLVQMVGDASLAEELASDTLVAAWKAAGSFKGQSKPSTWLFAIARNKALNELRKRAPQTVDIEAAATVAAAGEAPDASVHRDSQKRTIQQALQELSAEHREVVELAFYQGLSYEEISKIMKCPVNTVKTRMFYAKKRLQEALESRGISGEMS